MPRQEVIAWTSEKPGYKMLYISGPQWVKDKDLYIVVWGFYSSMSEINKIYCIKFWKSILCLCLFISPEWYDKMISCLILYKDFSLMFPLHGAQNILGMLTSRSAPCMMSVWILVLLFLKQISLIHGLTLLMLETEYSGFGHQYHACWCPGS